MSLTPRLDKIDKNYIINGNFDFWQRGTSFGSVAQFSYYADRWSNQSGANTSASISRQSSGLSNSIYCLRWTAGSTSSQFNLNQVLEDVLVNKLKGKYVTFSLKARINSGNVRTYAIAVSKNATANTQSGGSWSAISSSTPTALTTSFQTLKLTVLVPDDGSANGLKFGIYDTGTGLAADYIEITDAMAMETISGQEVLPDYFVGAGRNYAEELMLCQRYYEKSYNIDVAPGTNTLAGAIMQATTGDASGNHNFGILFTTRKRNTPSIVFYTNTGSTGAWGAVASNSTFNGYEINGPATVTTDVVGTSGLYGHTLSYAAYRPGKVYGHFTADAEL